MVEVYAVASRLGFTVTTYQKIGDITRVILACPCGGKEYLAFQGELTAEWFESKLIEHLKEDGLL